MSTLCGPGCGGYPSDCELTEALKEQARAKKITLERSSAWQAALPRAKQVKLLLLDVDGVLSDGSLHYSSAGVESKSFHVRDGLGLRLVQDSGVQVGIITARSSAMVERRAKELGFAHILQGQKEKLRAYEALLQETGLRPMHTAYMGDDWLDMPLLNRVGLAAAPADAAPELCQRVHYLAQARGGQGAVREVCDLILEAQGKLQQLFARYDR